MSIKFSDNIGMAKFRGGKSYAGKEFEISHYKVSHNNIIKQSNWDKAQLTSNADSHQYIYT